MPKTANKTLTPPHLTQGNLVALVTPAGTVTDKTELETGIKLLEDHGYRVRLPEDLAADNYLAGTDEERARQFTEAWRDEEVRAVLGQNGVLVANLSPNQDQNRNNLVKTFGSVFPGHLCLITGDRANTLVLGKKRVFRPGADFDRRVHRLEKRLGRGFGLKEASRRCCSFSLTNARLLLDPRP